jgi:Flp pilus assembly pilin Flp
MPCKNSATALAFPKNTFSLPNSRHEWPPDCAHAETERRVGNTTRGRTGCNGTCYFLGKGTDMKLINLFKSFKNDESGAVTVDWVVLTAAIVGLGMVVMGTVGDGITGLGEAIVTDLGTRQAGYENTP